MTVACQVAGQGWRTGIEVMVAVSIAKEHTPAELRALARRERDGRVGSRLLALANALDGMSRGAAARAAGTDRQTLRDWVHRYNAEGVAGLSNRRAPGPTPRLSDGQEAELARWVEKGADLERDGVVRWRCRDLRARIEHEFGVRFHERTVGKLLAKLRFRRLSVRPRHPEGDV